MLFLFFTQLVIKLGGAVKKIIFPLIVITQVLFLSACKDDGEAKTIEAQAEIKRLENEKVVSLFDDRLSLAVPESFEKMTPEMLVEYFGDEHLENAWVAEEGAVHMLVGRLPAEQNVEEEDLINLLGSLMVEYHRLKPQKSRSVINGKTVYRIECGDKDENIMIQLSSSGSDLYMLTLTSPSRSKDKYTTIGNKIFSSITYKNN